MTLTIQQTQDQRRAKDAWEKVASIKNNAGLAKKYKSLVKNAPADIQTSGLAQTVAFWRSKQQKEEHTKRLYCHVSAWIMAQIGLQSAQAQTELHEWILSASTEQYRRATVEALAYLGWLKRFAEAEIQGEENP